MSKRRVLSFLLALFLVCCQVSGPAYAVDNLDDILQGADPWADFESVSSAIGAVSVSEVFSAAEIMDGGEVVLDSPGDTLDLAGEYEIMPLTIPDTLVRDYQLYGVQDQDANQVDWTLYNPGTFTKTGQAYQTGGAYAFIASNGTASYRKWRFQSGAYVTYICRNSNNAPIYEWGTTDAVKVKGLLNYMVEFYFQGVKDGKYLTVNMYPTYAKLLINGKEYGEILLPDSDHIFRVNTVLNMDTIQNDIVSIGYKFGWSATTMIATGTDTTGNYKLLRCRLLVNDSVIWDQAEPDSNGQIVDSVDQTTEEVKKTNGLLASIIDFLKSIINSIGYILDSITSVLGAILELPGKIWSFIQNGLQLLFVPSTDELDDLYKQYDTFMQGKFGFIYQAFQLLDNLWQTVVDGWASHKDYAFDFPGITVNLSAIGKGSLTLVEAQKVSLDNEVMTALRSAAGTLISIVCVIATVHAMETMFIAVVSGKTYFDYLHGGKESEEGEGV